MAQKCSSQLFTESANPSDAHQLLDVRVVHESQRVVEQAVHLVVAPFMTVSQTSHNSKSEKNSKHQPARHEHRTAGEELLPLLSSGRVGPSWRLGTATFLFGT